MIHIMYKSIDDMVKEQHVDEIIIDADGYDNIYQFQGVVNTNSGYLREVGCVSDLCKSYDHTSLLREFVFLNRKIKIFSYTIDKNITDSKKIPMLEAKIDDINSIFISFVPCDGVTQFLFDKQNIIEGVYNVYFNGNFVYMLEKWCGNEHVSELIMKFFVHKDIIGIFYDT